MKRLILAAAIIAGSTFSANAGNGITKASNDSVILAGHQALATKISLFQTSLANNNATIAQIAANDILSLMQASMKRGELRVGLETTQNASANANQKYLSMEAAQHEFRQLLSNVSANSTQLLAKANAFLSAY